MIPPAMVTTGRRPSIVVHLAAILVADGKLAVGRNQPPPKALCGVEVKRPVVTELGGRRLCGKCEAMAQWEQR